ncbi:hypothetical protein B566_EDAN010770 [Ephemera danica]|nr:hypothetical protein B566_EDAN010770 [Ephemera danica]
MQCGIPETSEAGRASSSETMPRSGRVTEVCKEWLVLEDGALAYRLQNEEIEHHYMGNRFRNALVRQDIPRAKDEQRREEEEAANVQALYDQMIQEQEEMDAKIAQQLAEKLEHEEREKRMVHEREDKEIAHQYQERERQKIEKTHEKKPQHGVSRPEHFHDDSNAAAATSRNVHSRMPRAAEASNYTACSNAHGLAYEHSLAQELRKTSLVEENASGSSSSSRVPDHMRLSTNVDPLSDLSDFCLQPDPNMSEEEARLFQEEQDAELARLLQEQEMKRRGDSLLDRDRVMAVEAQDRELARMLQEKEKAKVKRARDRARQRSLMKKQQRQLESGETSSEACHSGDGNDVDERSSGSPPPLPSPGEWPEHTSPVDQDKKIPMKSRGRAKCPDPPGTLQNIAMAIDPTYPQRCNTQQLVQASASTATPVLASPVAATTPEFGEEEDLNAIPPYMPIQGQRRSSSLEKKTKKSKGKKESKDSCKQQ